MDELKERLESAKTYLQSLIDERPAASVSRILEAERAVKAAEEALFEATEAQKVEEKVVSKKVKKGVR